MNYKEVARGLSGDESSRYSEGIIRMERLAVSLQEQGLLPERFSSPIVISQPEVFGEPVTFTNEERKVLREDGAVLYLPTGETIRGQGEAGRLFWHVADGYIESGKMRLTEFRSRKIEVAIYPDPERFFVPGSFNHTTDYQIAKVEQAARSLRERLGLPNIDEILPEASEATEVLFRHFDATNVRLLGQDYMDHENGVFRYMRTSTPTNRAGSRVAHVGIFGAGGLSVLDWKRSASGAHIGAAHWVVPQRSS